MKAINYIPVIREKPKINVVKSAWEDIPTILKDIIVRFNLKQDLALDLGVYFGYSTVALACYFKKVIGVDTFRDDLYDNNPLRPSNISIVRANLKKYPNIQLVESMYQDYIKINPDAKYDLIHIDMIHTYRETFKAGQWAVQHSDCVIFHDTDAYLTVYEACGDLATDFNLEFYNYNMSFGLGILVKK